MPKESSMLKNIIGMFMNLVLLEFLKTRAKQTFCHFEKQQFSRITSRQFPIFLRVPSLGESHFGNGQNEIGR